MDSGIDQNALDSDRNTALHILLTKGHAEKDVLACFLKARPHLDAKNSSGKTVLDLARCKKVRSVVRAAERVPGLQCLAAREIIREKLQYEGIVPKRLETFIQLH